MASHPDEIRLVHILERGPAGDGVTSGEAATINSRLTALEAATPPTAIDDLTDVDTTTNPPSAADILIWDNANSEWRPYTPAAITVPFSFSVTFGDGVNQIATGVHVPNPRLNFPCTITRGVLLSSTGSVTTFTLDIWKDTFANYPPTDADSITGGNPLTLSGASGFSDATLTGWTTTINADDILRFNVDAASSDALGITLTLYMTRSIGPAI